MFFAGALHSSQPLLTWLRQMMLTCVRGPTFSSVTPIVLSSAPTRRCLGNPIYFHYHQPLYHHSSLSLQEQRIRRNVARLYARRILEIAAASAATQRFIAGLSSADVYHAAASQPTNWKNWSRKEWSAEMLQCMGKTQLSRIWAATRRLAMLSILAAPFTVLYPLSLVSPTAERVSWRYALWGIEQAGPTMIKLFQWATTRQDLFSPEFCHYFGKLRDETVGHTWGETMQLLEEELGIVAKDPIDTDNDKDDTHSNEYFVLQRTPIGSGKLHNCFMIRALLSLLHLTLFHA